MKNSGSEGFRIAIINGANINMLGVREPNFYGKESWSDIENSLNQYAKKEDIQILYFQSNHEGQIVDYIQENYKDFDGIVINPAAFSKAGYSILEAILAVQVPFVEVHLSNIYARGGWHAETIFSSEAVGVISGFKGLVYELGTKALVEHLKY